MIKVVKENPCNDCKIKGLYENCDDKCVQYRKWYQYQQGRADERVKVLDEVIKAIDEKNYCMQEECPFYQYCSFQSCPIDIDAEEIIKTWLMKLKEQKNE